MDPGRRTLLFFPSLSSSAILDPGPGIADDGSDDGVVDVFVSVVSGAFVKLSSQRLDAARKAGQGEPRRRLGADLGQVSV